MFKLVVDSATKDAEVACEEIYFGVNHIEIVDNNFIPQIRDLEFVGVIKKNNFAGARRAYSITGPDIVNDEVIFMKYLMMSNEGA